MHLRLKFIVANQVEKMLRGIQCPLNHLPSCKKQLHFHLFWDATKNDDINEFFIFIQIDINHKYKLHMELQTIL